MRTGFKSKIIASKMVTVENPEPVVKFVRPAAKNYPKDGWDRYFFIQDKPAYYLGTCCETCYFIFRKIPGDFANLSIKNISEKLNHGLKAIDEDLLSIVCRSLPSGDYGAFLIELLPVLVQPKSDDDFFNHKLYIDFGADDYSSDFFEYYRSETIMVDESRSVFEFVIPMFDHSTLDKSRVNAYRQAISEGKKPTALAASILDTKWVDDFDDYDDLVEYPICLANFLLDGHHKMYAAALEKSPITLLSVVSKVESIWYEDGIEHILESMG